MGHQEQSIDIEATVLPKTYELLKDLREGFNLSMGAAIDRLALQIQAQSRDQAICLILEDIAAIVSGLRLEQVRDALHDVASTLAALLPAEAMEDIRQEALEKRVEIIKGLMNLPADKATELRLLFERINASV